MATVNHQLNFTTQVFRDKGGEGREIFILKRTQTESSPEKQTKIYVPKTQYKAAFEDSAVFSPIIVLSTSSISSSSFRKLLLLHFYYFTSVFSIMLTDCCKECGAALSL